MENDLKNDYTKCLDAWEMWLGFEGITQKELFVEVVCLLVFMMYFGNFQVIID
jgi:hypothetical protein